MVNSVYCITEHTIASLMVYRHVLKFSVFQSN